MIVLHLISTDGISGAEKHIRHLLPGLRAYQFECRLMLICPPGTERNFTDFIVELKSENIETVLMPAKKAVSFSVAKKINAYLRNNGIDTVHSHLIRADLLAALVKQFLFRKLFIISTRHGYQEKILVNYSPDNFKIPNNVYYFITKYILSKVDCNISISHCISQLFLNFKLTKKYFEVVYHGVEVAGKSETEVAALRLSANQLIIVGRLEAYKGHRFVIEAMPAVLEKFPDTKLLFAGNGSERNNLEMLAARLGVAESVCFLGFQPDPYSLIIASDLVIIPSLFEPFGLVFIEAMALHTPVVAFNVPAANELLNDQIGLLADRGDVAGMAAGITDLLADPDKRKKLADRAYNDYLEKFTIPVMVKNTAELYARVLPA